MKEKQSGITLIALVITIIVLLILAGVSLSITVGENGILQKATSAKIDSEIAREKEQILLAMNSSFGDDGKNAKVIDKTKMEQNLQASEGKDKVKLIADIEEDDSFYVKFVESNRYYEIDPDRNVTLIEVTGGEKQLTVKCVDSNKNVLATKTWTILKDNFSKTLPEVEGYLPEKDRLTGTITKDTTEEVLYYFLIPESQMVFTGLTSSGAVTTNESQIASYMVGNNSSTNGNGLVSAPTNLSALKIPETHNRKPVTKVGARAFNSVSKIAIVNIGNNVKSIEAYGFSYCSEIKTLTIGSGLNSAESHAFVSCSKLKTIIYNNETDVINGIGNGCGNWTEIQINSGNTKFKVVDNILYSKDGSKIVKVPSGISGSFSIAEGITEIGANAFDRCTKLTEINIGNSVTTIGNSAFSQCTGMTKLIIGSGLNSIATNGFISCSNLKTIIYNNETDAIKGIGNGCGNWTEIQINSGNTKFKVVDNILYSKDGSKIVKVPSGISGSFTIAEGITEIGANAFDRCTKLTEINIGNSVTTIGNSAFSQCTGMTKLIIGSGLNSIATNGFISCSNLKTIIYNNETDAIKGIGNGCGNWTEIQINSGNTKFKVVDNILYSKDGSKIVKVPSGISGSFTIAEGITEIGANAFDRCTKLTEINIGNSVTTIGNSAFSQCTGMTKLIIGSGLNSIATNGFNSCSVLKTIVYNNETDAIKVIGNGCGNWTEIQINSGNTKFKVVDNILYSKDGNKIVKVPSGISGSFTIAEGITEIGANAFDRCTKLTEINIGNSVTTIGNNAFSQCTGMTKLIIGSGLNSIATNGFNNCSNLKTVIIDSSTIASALTSQTSCGRLVESATTVYTKSTPGSYITTNFKTTTSDKAGYTKYVKK